MSSKPTESTMTLSNGSDEQYLETMEPYDDSTMTDSEIYSSHNNEPFDGAVGESAATTREMQEEEDDLVADRELPSILDISAVRGRGSLIGGVLPPSNMQVVIQPSQEYENSVCPPDSDYASQPPSSLWQNSLDSSTARRQARKLVGEEVEPIVPTKRSKKSWWIGLGIVSLLLVGAVFTVSWLVSGKGRQSGVAAVTGTNDFPTLSTRQEALDSIIRAVSDSDLFGDSSSPRYKARRWLLLNDTLSLDPANGTTASRVVQRYVLALFFFSTGGWSSWESNNWLNGDECGRTAWNGIDCNDDAQVKTIALNNQGMSGTLPWEIGHLSSMENFILKNEPGLSGAVPSSLGKLGNLTQLGLYNCKLDGSIPTEIFLATSLVYLNLENNSLTGFLPSEIGRLSELRTLALMNNKLEGTIPFNKLALPNLRYLGLSSNLFTGTVAPNVAVLSNLLFLYIDHNKLGGTLPASLGSLSRLVSMNLDQNGFNGSLPSTIRALKRLEYLSMQFNQLEGSIPAVINQLSSLKVLGLSANKFTGQIPDLSLLSTLESLFLFQNSLSGTIPSLIQELPNLEILFLSSNNFTGVVPEGPYARNAPLRGLFLSDNKLEGPIPLTLCDLINLEEIFLDENSITGSIPSCIGDLQNLKQLYLFKNQLTGDVPTSLGSLEMLAGLGLEDNKLLGSVPQQVCSTNQSLDLWSDCGGPELTCSCCTVCCPSSSCY